jgi:hypothetical protein
VGTCVRRRALNMEHGTRSIFERRSFKVPLLPSTHLILWVSGFLSPIPRSRVVLVHLRLPSPFSRNADIPQFLLSAEDHSIFRIYVLTPSKKWRTMVYQDWTNSCVQRRTSFGFFFPIEHARKGQVWIGLQNISSHSSDVDFRLILLQVNEITKRWGFFLYMNCWPGSYYPWLSGQVMWIVKRRSWQCPTNNYAI